MKFILVMFVKYVGFMFDVIWMLFFLVLFSQIQKVYNIEVNKFCFEGMKFVIKIVCFFDFFMLCEVFMFVLKNIMNFNNLQDILVKNIEVFKVIFEFG